MWVSTSLPDVFSVVSHETAGLSHDSEIHTTA